MENKIIVEFMSAIRGDIKAIVKEAVAEVLAENNFGAGATVVKPEAKAKESNPHELAQKAVNKAEKAVKEVKEEAPKADEAGDRRAELSVMKYNDLKVLVKELGGKAVGNASSIVEQILELEAKKGDAEDAEESKDQEADAESNEEATSNGDADDSSDDAGASEEGEVDEENEQAFREFLGELDKEALFEIGASLEVKKPKKWNKDSYIELLLVDLDALYTALEELGYYDEEDGDKEDLVDNEEDNESEDEEASLADELSEKTLEELAEICSENGLSTKGKKQALVDRIVKAVEAGEVVLDGEDAEGSEDEEGEDEEWYTQEELEAMTNDELVEIAEMNELEIPKKKSGKKSVMDKDALIEAILALGEAEEDGDDQEDSEDNEDESEDSGDDFEVSDERVAKEEEVEEEIRAQYKAKKLKDATIKKFLEKYNEGNPKYKAPAKDEALEDYIDIKIGLVDDEGELHDVEDCYLRDEEYFCCGKQLGEVEGQPYCSVCGTQYES